MARLEKFYTDEVAPALMKKFGYKSVMQIPKLEKIVVNVGCGEARDNQKIVEAIMGDLAKITGQKLSKVKADMERDYWMSPQEAVKYGLVDKVLSKLS